MEKTGKNLNDLLDSNRSQLLYYLIDHPGCSRADLGTALNLSLASITKIMYSLLDAGVVYETGFSKGKKGRRSVGLSFNYGKYKVLASRLSWNHLKMQAYDFLGNACGEKMSIPLEEVSVRNIEDAMSAAKEGIAYFRSKYPEIIALGMSVPGPYYRDTGNILLPPYEKDAAKRHFFPLRERLSELAGMPVFVEHDADAGALGYWWFRTDRSPHYVIMNFLGDAGIGVGLTDGRRVFTETSSRSFESGHITIDFNGRRCPYCGSNGCINAYCSDKALVEQALEQLPSHPDSRLNRVPDLTCEDILCASREDAFARELLTECGKYLGHGIISLLHVFNPDLILISGPLSKAGSPLLDGIWDSIWQRHSNYTEIPQIRLLSEERELTLLGAVAFAVDQMLQTPTHSFALPVNNQAGSSTNLEGNA